MVRVLVAIALLAAGCGPRASRQADTTIAAAASSRIVEERPSVSAGPAPFEVPHRARWAYDAAAGAVAGLEPDRRLDRAAAALLDLYLRTGQWPTRARRDQAARQAGVAEPVPLALLVAGGRRGDLVHSLGQELATRCHRVGCNRVGLAPGATEAGEVVVALLMNSSLRLAPVQTQAQPGDPIRLRGSLPEAAERLEVLVATPQGEVETVVASTERAFDATFVVTEAGRYNFEVVGVIDGSPTVLALFSVAVGVDRRLPPPAAPPGQTVEPAAARELLRRLLNEARRGVGVGELASHPALCRAAQAHADAMATGAFFSHRDAEGRGPAERVALEGLASPLVLEDIAVAPTAEQAFATLIESPAHLRAILSPHTTHVGIGVSPQGDEGMSVAVVMAQVSPALGPEAAARRVVDAIDAARRARALPALGRDAGLEAAALATAALLERLAAAGAPLEAARQEAERSLIAHGTSAARAVLLTTPDLADAARVEASLDPSLSRAGVAARPAADVEAGYHVVVLLGR